MNKAMIESDIVSTLTSKADATKRIITSLSDDTVYDRYLSLLFVHLVIILGFWAAVS